MKKLKLLTAVLLCLGIGGMASAVEVINIDLNGYGNPVAYTGMAAFDGGTDVWNAYYAGWGKAMGSPRSSFLADYDEPNKPSIYASQVWIGDDGQNHGYLPGSGTGLMDDGFVKTGGPEDPDPCIGLWGIDAYEGTFDIYVYGDANGSFKLDCNSREPNSEERGVSGGITPGQFVENGNYVVFQNVNVSSDPNYVTISYTNQLNGLQLVRLNKQPVAIEGNDTNVAGPEYDAAYETNCRREGGEFSQFGPDVNARSNLVMSIDKGEYMDYDIYVAEANEGEYEVRYEISSNQTVRMEFYLDGFFVGEVSHSATNGSGPVESYFEWTNPFPRVKLFSGPHTVRWSTCNGDYGFNVHKLKFHRVGDAVMADCNEVYKYGYGLEEDFAGASNIGGYPGYSYIYHDCHVDFNDLAVIAGNWPNCYDLDPNGPDYREEVNADDPCLYITFDEEPPKDHSGHNYWVGKGPLALIEKTAGSVGKAVRLGRVGGGCYIGESPPLNDSNSSNNGDSRSWVAAANRQTEPPIDNNDTEYYSAFGHQYAFTPNDVTFEFWFKSCVRIDNRAAFFNQARNNQDTIDKYLKAPAVSRSNREVDDPNGGKVCPPDTPCSRQMRALTIGGWAYSDYDVWPFDGDWHHVVIAYDENDINTVTGLDDGLRVKVYLDTNLIVNDVNGGIGGQGGGVPFASRGKVGPEMDHIMIGNLGSRNNSFSGTTANPWAGYIDEFAIYQGVLPEARIDAHYNAWQPKSCAEMRERERGILDFDGNRDCKIDFFDLGDFVLSWLACNDPCDAYCMPNW